MASRTLDGYSWTLSEGLQRGGFVCEGVINPSQRLTAPAQHIYDVVIIGGGYSGLSAARDLTSAGNQCPP